MSFHRKDASKLVAICAICLVSASLSANAEEKLLWEAGLGVGTLVLPDYRGSDESRAYVLPVPYLIYRGEFFKADRDGVRARFLDSDRVKLELAVNASQPVSSSSNRTREGMPDLKGSFEIGPSLSINLARWNDRRAGLDLRVPVSTGVTIGGGWRGIGWQTSPRLNLDIESPGGYAGWNLGLVAGPIFQNRQRNAYFYDVPEQFARPGRPTYRSGGGYAGTQFIAALSRRFDSYWVGGFVRADTLSGATFENSPLVRRKHYVAAGIGLAWVFGKSAQRVQVDEP